MIVEKKVKTLGKNNQHEFTDHVAIEAPLEISWQKETELETQTLAVTMRTPGNDMDLALGFLFTEGILHDFAVVERVVAMEENKVTVVVQPDTSLNVSQSDRNFYTTSSCGVCGKSSIEAIRVQNHFQSQKGLPKVDKSTFYALQSKLLEDQSAFEQTGGIHAAALFNESGKLLHVREDVGRHNALDKLIGYAWSQGYLPLQQHILLLSGRASFELVQKAVMAGIPIIASVGAPSSLAIALAEEHGTTLIGFLKEDRFNLYCDDERIR